MGGGNVELTSVGPFLFRRCSSPWSYPPSYRSDLQPLLHPSLNSLRCCYVWFPHWFVSRPPLLSHSGSSSRVLITSPFLDSFRRHLPQRTFTQPLRDVPSSFFNHLLLFGAACVKVVDGEDQVVSDGREGSLGDEGKSAYPGFCVLVPDVVFHYCVSWLASST